MKRRGTVREPAEVRKWRDANPRLTMLGLERELAACASVGPVEAFRAYLDALDASSRASAWTPPDRDAAMRAIAARVADEIDDEGGLGAKRPFGNSDIGTDVAKIVGIDLDLLAGGEWSGDPAWAGSPRAQAYEWCERLWAEWPEWLRERVGPAERGDE